MELELRLLATAIMGTVFAGCQPWDSCVSMEIASRRPAYLVGEPIELIVRIQNNCRDAVRVTDPNWEFAPFNCRFRTTSGDWVGPWILEKRMGLPYSDSDVMKRQISLESGQSIAARHITSHRQGEILYKLGPGTYEQWCEFELFHEGFSWHDAIDSTPPKFSRIRSNETAIVVHEPQLTNEPARIGEQSGR